MAEKDLQRTCMNVYLTAGAIVVVFLVFEFIQMRFIHKDETKTMKELTWTSCIVFASAITSLLLGEHVNKPAAAALEVFTGEPGF